MHTHCRQVKVTEVASCNLQHLPLAVNLRRFTQFRCRCKRQSP